MPSVGASLYGGVVLASAVVHAFAQYQTNFPGAGNPMYRAQAQPLKWQRYMNQVQTYNKGLKKMRAWPPPPPITNKQCPLKKCRGISKKQINGGLPASLLETKSSNHLAATEPIKPLKPELGPGPDELHEVDPDTGLSIYEVNFKPGHFSCLSCDVQSCAGCDIICDLSLCIGEFYTQECWCEKDTSVRLKKPLWWFREYDAKFMTHDSVYQFFCDNSCKGGICDVNGIQCKKREEACKPWWWCNLPPPSTDNLKPTDGWDDGFSYISTPNFMQVQQNARREYAASSSASKARSGLRRSKLKKGRSLQSTASTVNLQMREATQAAVAEKERLAAQEKAGAEAKGDRVFEPNDFGKMNFSPGRWECDSGALPPRVQDPASYLWNDRGYIVFDRHSCKGSTFTHKCFCWDNVKYLQGQDPLVSEMKCDNTCSWGNCEGKTCGQKPPGPLPPVPPAPPMDPIAAEQARSGELKQSDNKMTPA